ncbi:hypothetical protein [Amycolatopsis sp. CA-230715]|uniref:hypothetical protein n=1 Tax=Amycolatopsis sp. CA-230715 TaxID=2745196 RepID=UPI001C03A2B1|nr:hypothetical protein [Amycolatopsis sp. CA-230715]QWF77983.1 hypothetical protein HUW46_01376 [Amycolatopsis sp. CA-230715]
MTGNRDHGADRIRATAVVERYARDPAELAELLDMLGLLSRPEDRAPAPARGGPGRRLLISELAAMVSAQRPPAAAPHC